MNQVGVKPLWRAVAVMVGVRNGTFTPPRLSKLGCAVSAKRQLILGRWLAIYPKSLEGSLGVSKDRSSCRSRKTSCGPCYLWLTPEVFMGLADSHCL